ncbi:MAG: Hsp70 family protein, partial [Pseudomonadota bacterium]
MLKTLTKAALAAGFMMTSAVAGWAAGHAEITIRATANSNENDEDYDGLVVFKNYVEAASNGRIAVELFIGTQLCSKGAECLQGVADGSIDVYISTSGGAAGLFPYVQVLDLPYLMSDDRVAESVLQGDFTRTMRSMALADSGDTIRLMTPFITATADGPKHIEKKLSRSQFESLCTDLIGRLRAPVQQSMNDARVSPSQIDEVVLVGGSSRMPMVQHLVRSLLSKEPNQNVNPDEAVAVGAAIQAG